MKKSVLTIGLCVLLLFAYTSAVFAEGQKEAMAEGEKHFEGINIVFFPGGNEGCPFASVVYRGALAAEYDLGVDVEYVWSDWLNDKMIAQFKDAVARRPDGIAVMGHPGDAALAPLVDDARSRGIVVTSQNTSLPTIEAKYKAEGFGYVGQDLYGSGKMLAEGAASRAGLKPGDRVMVWGLLGQETRGLRTKGAIDVLEEMGMTVDYIEISDAVNSDPAQGTPIITSYISTKPDVKLIITDHGALTSTVGTYLRAARKNPGDIYVGGFDLSAASVDAINSGYLGVVLDQQPFLQGYLPVLQLALTIKYGFSGLNIDTGAALIDKSNIAFVAPLAKEGFR
ncbi:MAG: substrate-binding domain-containing protein [Spirochaetia bacterium]|nr:substrate-binding domain-containing protein [Spirochaetia bacterium]